MALEMHEQPLGSLLQARRKARGLTMESLAAQAGVHRTTLSRWEREKSIPFAHELNCVLDALSVGQKERQPFYQALEVPRAIHIAGAGAEGALPVSGGELLRALRTRAKVSQRTVARAAHVAQSLIVKWENNDCWPNGAHLHAFCFATGATEEELVFLTTRAWRRMEPLPLDKEALDDLTIRASATPTPTLSATYVALAARYHDLYRAAKISEVEATAVYGFYANHVGCVLKRNDEARQIAAPVLAGLTRSRGTMSFGQVMAVDCQLEYGDTAEINDLNAPVRRHLNRNLEANLALLDALSNRYPAGYGAIRIHQIAETWERAGNAEAALSYYKRSVASAVSAQQATHRSYAYVEFLCRQKQFRQAAAQLRPSSDWAWETRPMVHIKNWCNHAEVFAGLKDYTEAEDYLTRAVAHARQHNLERYSGPEFVRIGRAIESSRKTAGRNRKTE